ncbi:MAG: cyclopropane-fatty-acyl-phospholipid synthase family protein [Gammaproteobacteria bacterium]|nr:cyclopropane-fatty-acyl-phospholipid synthase family protein [Gammaproteobacteria bacterium]
MNEPSAPAVITPLAALGRRLLLRQFATLRDGELRIIEPDGTRHQFGQRTPRLDLTITLHIDHPQLYADAAFGGTVGAGDAYIRGLWRCDDLTGLVRLFVVNRDMMNGMDSRWSLLSRPLLKAFHFLNRNSRRGSARNIAAHYDLGNALYELMLDPTMAYSCGIFESEASTLEQASVAKFEAVCRKLRLGPGDRVVEIGTGWGGLALHAAAHYGCHVITTTISREQHDYTREKIARAGLGDRITLLLEDYRDLRGSYDKAMSIEMIEAVGADYLDTYLAKCAALLEPHGAMLLQAITLQDQFYEQARKSVDYIQRFVFPGSFIPSVEAISRSLTRVTDLKIFHLEDIGPHYARTLREWRLNFFGNLERVRSLGYPDSFVRLWEYYLCYCEGGFEERQLGDVQLLLTKPGCRLPPPGIAAVTLPAAP